MSHDILNISLEEISIDKNIPLHATIELLTECNWKCKHCYIPEHNDSGLNIETITKLLNDLRELGTFDVTFTGGEIFFRQDVLEIIEIARSLNFRVNLLSNASMLNKEKVEKLANLYIAEFSTTIFSLNSLIHDSITGISGSLEKVLNNIFLMDKYNIPIEIKTPLMKENSCEYKELKSFCDKNNFKYQVTTAISSKNNGDISPVSLRIDNNDYAKIIKDIDRMQDIGESKKIKPLFDFDDYLCKPIINNIYIDCKGNVYPCNSFLCKVGNIFDSSISDIWNNSEELKKIKRMKKKDLPECVNCDLIDFCGRCPGLALSEDKTLYGCSSVDRQIAIARKQNSQQL
ncbi:radical SAM protein [Tissierella carlieri]|jgi:radical SAM protein with 4Fe4S-binding SPASM domain|uniref:radical SAM/SPASM domain-containing protein n=1 Tax=Tissierella carlieri TaxID=689904 RepID=UPI001C11D5F8|nr:radical SAM protein [Tissierella carlieri]MBU5310666.1 radical SAM protein [Tissierella carlieri]MDU5080947.1 radical SAM protein [Bacillota bacterium]